MSQTNKVIEDGRNSLISSGAIFNQMQELLSFSTSARACVNRLQACTCTKGIGITRKSRRFCDHCEALHMLGEVRRRIQELKEIFRPNESKTETKTDQTG